MLLFCLLPLIAALKLIETPWLFPAWLIVSLWQLAAFEIITGCIRERLMSQL